MTKQEFRAALIKAVDGAAEGGLGSPHILLELVTCLASVMAVSSLAQGLARDHAMDVIQNWLDISFISHLELYRDASRKTA